MYPGEGEEGQKYNLALVGRKYTASLDITLVVFRGGSTEGPGVMHFLPFGNSFRFPNDIAIRSESQRDAFRYFCAWWTPLFKFLGPPLKVLQCKHR